MIHLSLKAPHLLTLLTLSLLTACGGDKELANDTGTGGGDDTHPPEDSEAVTDSGEDSDSGEPSVDTQEDSGGSGKDTGDTGSPFSCAPSFSGLAPSGTFPQVEKDWEVEFRWPDELVCDGGDWKFQAQVTDILGDSVDMQVWDVYTGALIAEHPMEYSAADGFWALSLSEEEMGAPCGLSPYVFTLTAEFNGTRGSVNGGDLYDTMSQTSIGRNDELLVELIPFDAETDSAWIYVAYPYEGTGAGPFALAETGDNSWEISVDLQSQGLPVDPEGDYSFMNVLYGLCQGGELVASGSM